MSARGTPTGGPLVAPPSTSTTAVATEYKACPYFPVPIQAESRHSKDSRQQLGNGMQRSHRVLSVAELALGRGTRWMELEITGKVRSLSQDLFALTHLTSLFLNGNLLTRLPPEIASLKNLCLLDLSQNKLRSLPVELGDIISLVHLLLNYNQIRVLPYELGKLFRLSTLGLHGNPLSPDIAKLYHEPNGTQHLLQHLLDHLAINTAPPPDRSWVRTERVDGSKPLATVSVLCYNVLSDKYASSSLYSYCPSWALNWEYRKKAIMGELRHYDADIVALQEVETEQFGLFFRPEMAALGYAAVFSPKSRAKTMAEEDAKYVDGCALFWKTDKLCLERQELIEFNSMAISSAQGHEAMLNRVMIRDNIALAAVLRCRDAVYNFPPQNASDSVVGAPLVVCTAHVHWDPEFCDVKLVQTMMLVSKLSGLVKEVGEAFRLDPAKVPTLICGDLNSLPDSGVIEYMAKSKIPKAHLDFKSFRTGAESILGALASAHSEPDHYNHPLRLASAYSPTDIPFTNYTLDFKGLIDYVFATPATLHKLGVLGPLDPAWLRQHKIIGCPHPHVPSDHIPILAQYALLSPSATGHRQPQHHSHSTPNFHHGHPSQHSLWSHNHS